MSLVNQSFQAPIIFVAHSLGGIIVKDVRCDSSVPKRSQMAALTHHRQSADLSIAGSAPSWSSSLAHPIEAARLLDGVS